MVRFVAQESKQYLSSAWLLYRLPGGFNGYEDGIDLRQDVRIVKCKHPASIAHIIVVEDSQASNRFLGTKVFAPYVERDFRIHFSRICEVVCIKNEGLPFGVENATKRALALAVPVPVVHINNMEIARDYELSDVTRFRRELLLLTQRLCLIGDFFSKFSNLGVLQSHGDIARILFRPGFL